MNNPFIKCLETLTRDGQFISYQELDDSIKKKLRDQVLKCDREKLLEGFRQCINAVIAYYVADGSLQNTLRNEISEEIEQIYREKYPDRAPNTMVEGLAHIPFLTEAEVMHMLFGRIAVNTAMGSHGIAFNRAKIYDLLFSNMANSTKSNILPEGMRNFAAIAQQLSALQAFFVAEIDNPKSALALDPMFNLEEQLPFNMLNYQNFYNSMSDCKRVIVNSGV